MAYRDYYVVLRSILSNFDGESFHSASLHVEDYLIEHSVFGCGFRSAYKARSYVRLISTLTHIVKFDDNYYVLPDSDYVRFKNVMFLLSNGHGFSSYNRFCHRFDYNLNFFSAPLNPSPLPDIVNESCDLPF